MVETCNDIFFLTVQIDGQYNLSNGTELHLIVLICFLIFSFRQGKCTSGYVG